MNEKEPVRLRRGQWKYGDCLIYGCGCLGVDSYSAWEAVASDGQIYHAKTMRDLMHIIDNRKDGGVDAHKI